ncbi:uncharacterized protein SPPG_07362 [Spizellomyces punctatus DAOM BR117]|uniref:Uncharacterized protein n=1 Tax=Spizellomyces punctatus (strain DAOM BR117) TaxID=645134 RepID=A0A0L0H8W4_SPIPD|nr:uncharacterized protein SPPG_07362 [Spizellomyces punctatus DAOM BR117]KNC97441.1 hypothetical protein SPPG_07362 [Spizellomyces punctatus DAOM BR117]|eukprot:XP_016605481.1 hypothetical protein SPPG_07362 [Spizellomyces punctatus DAOM BR117]
MFGIPKRPFAPPADTPGPGAYDVQSSLLNGDKHKHYGFLNKAERFKALKAEEQLEQDEDGTVDLSFVKPAVPTRVSRVNGEDPQKLRKEIEKWQDQYYRQVAINDKQRQELEERIARTDAQLQNSVKEKNALQSLSTAKDKELADLLRKHALLKQSLEKSEKQSFAQQDRASKAVALQKKIEDLQKQNDRLNERLKPLSLADRQYAKEKESFSRQLQESRELIKSAVQEKEEALSVQHDLEMRLQDFEAQQHKLMQEAQIAQNAASEEYQKIKKTLLMMTDELRAAQLELQQTKSARDESLKKTRQITEKNAELEVANRDAITSHHAQQEAYLVRITELEGKLEEQRKLSSQQEQFLTATIADLEGKEEHHRLQLEMAESAVMKLKSDLSRSQSERDNERENMESIMASLKKSYQDLNTTYQQLMVENHEEISRYQKSVNTLKKELQEQAEERARIQLTLDRSTGTIQDLQTEMGRLHGRLQDTDAEFADLKTEHMRTLSKQQERQAIIDELKSTIDRVEKQLRDKERDMQLMEAELRRHQSDLEHLTDNIDGKEADLSQTQTQLHDMRNANLELKKQLEQADVRIATFAAKIEEQERDARDNERRSTELQNMNADLRKDIAFAKEEIDMLKEHVSGTTGELEVLRMELRNRESEVEELVSIKNAMGDELSELRESLSQAEKQSKADIAALSNDVKTRDATIINLQDQLRDLTDAASRDQETIQDLREMVRSKTEEIMTGTASYQAILEQERIAAAEQQERAERKIGSLMDNISSLKAELQCTTSELTTVQELLSDTQTTLTQRSATLGERETHIEELVRQLQTDKEEANEERRQHAQLLDSLRKQREAEGERWQAQAAEMSTTLTEREETIRRLEHDHRLLQQDLEKERDAHAREAKELIDERDNLRSELEMEIASLQKALEEANRESLQLKTIMQELRAAHSAEIGRIKSEMKAQEASFAEKMDETRTIHEAERAKLKGELLDTTNALVKLNAVLEDEQSKSASVINSLKMDLANQASEHDRESEQMKKKHDEDLKLASASLAKLQQELEEQRAASSSDIACLTAKVEAQQLELERKLREAEVQYDACKAALEKELDAEKALVAQLKEDLGKEQEARLDESQRKTREIEALKSEHDCILQRTHENHELALKKVQEQADESVSNLTAALEEQSNNHDAEKQHLRNDFEAKLQGIQMGHMTDVARLTSEIATLSEAKRAAETETQLMRVKVKDIEERLQEGTTRIEELEKSLEQRRTEVDREREAKQEAESRSAEIAKELEMERNTRGAAIRNSLKEVAALKAELTETRNALSVTELKKANELSTKDVQLRKLQNDLRSRINEISEIKNQAKSAVASAKKDAEKAREELSKVVEERHRWTDMEKELREVEKARERENLELTERLKDMEEVLGNVTEQNDRLKVLLEDEERRRNEMEASHQSQLDLLKTRGQLKENEVKKLGELNAELFGHANTKQKIRHVAQLKEENVKLKTDNVSLSRRCEDMKRKIMNLEREVESFRAIGAVGGGGHPRKLSRVGRSVLAKRQDPETLGNFTLAGESIEETEEDIGENKENTVNFASGGISFVV